MRLVKVFKVSKLISAWEAFKSSAGGVDGNGEGGILYNSLETENKGAFSILLDEELPVSLLYLNKFLF